MSHGNVVANDHRGLVLAEHEFQRKGRTHVYRTAHVYRIEESRLAEFREYPKTSMRSTRLCR